MTEPDPYAELRDDPNPDSMKRLIALAQQQLIDAAEVAAAEQKLKAAKAKYEEISGKLIPELMDELGYKSFTTKSGHSIAVERVLKHSVSKDKAPAAHRWLEEHDLGGIIKRQVFVDFPATEEDAARELVGELGEREFSVGVNRKVEASTLKATLKDLLAREVAVPEDLFGIYYHTRTKITRKKTGGHDGE